MTGGVAQAYATMGASYLFQRVLMAPPRGHNANISAQRLTRHLGFTTCMKTAEITRAKTAATGVKPPSTWAVFGDIYRREGLAGVNKGVNAVAVRQCTNWGSR
jgi:hypothetical protein